MIDLSPDQRNVAYRAAVAASERIRDDLLRIADQVHADQLDTAHGRIMASRRTLDDLAERDRAQAIASDGRAAVYDSAHQQHHDRLAVLARHCGQHYRGPGLPDAAHARKWLLEKIDPPGAMAAAPPAPPNGEPAMIEFGGVRYDRRVASIGGQARVVPDGSVGDTPRGTFAGSPEEFATLKARAVMTPAERAELPGNAPPTNEMSARRIVAPKPESAIPEAPPGLLADIAAILARTAR